MYHFHQRRLAIATHPHEVTKREQPSFPCPRHHDHWRHSPRPKWFARPMDHYACFCFPVRNFLK